ncbi:hypothetical protein BRAS3843_3160022 [Bradyrhizobium sp. STM 3843]|nr:hypothetical protein BRAS3843_3160022 [Bradyrhizobium sp. STM 3843]
MMSWVWAQAPAGGEGGIRTPDRLAPMPHFECGAFNHSATSPGANQGTALWSRRVLGHDDGGDKAGLTIFPARSGATRTSSVMEMNRSRHHQTQDDVQQGQEVGPPYADTQWRSRVAASWGNQPKETGVNPAGLSDVEPLRHQRFRRNANRFLT